MSKRTHLTNDEIRQINDLHREGLYGKDIAEHLGRSQAAVSRALKKTAPSPEKSCPTCRRKLPQIEGIMYCCYCGADIRSPGAKAAAKLHEVLRNISNFYPANLRDDAIAAINNAIEILEEA